MQEAAATVAHHAGRTPPLADMLSAHELFDRLVFVGRQMAAVLLSEALAGRKSIVDQVMLERCRDELAQIREDLRRGSEEAGLRHFRHHLIHATARLAEALFDWGGRRSVNAAGRDPLPQVKDALRQLDLASRLVPGLAVIDAQQACCAGHGAALPG